VAVLDPEVVARADWGGVHVSAPTMARGARTVAEHALSWSRVARVAQPALVNGTAGLVAAPRGSLLAVMGFTVRHDKIVEIDVLLDPARLHHLTNPTKSQNGRALPVSRRTTGN
jgi:RNA polymerase sigma-70 factor, ECF subfamily